MIKVKEAIKIIEKSITSMSDEKVDILSSVGRYSAEDVTAKIDNPPFNMSAMDGYALKYSKNFTKSTKFNVRSEIFAGSRRRVNLKKFEAARIYTGGKIPNGTDTVVIQEDAKILKKDLVSFRSPFEKNQFVRKKGRDFKAGQIVLKKNTLINEKDLGLLVSSNNKFIKVKKKPRIIVISTGDEIVKKGNLLKEGQIFASSLYMLEKLLEKSGCICVEKKILKDNIGDLKKYFKKIKKIDLIITTGGISVGKKDLVKETLLELGLKLKFWKVLIKPGKPILFGIFKKVPIFSLPGNPVSTYVCFLVFVLKAINKLNGSKTKDIEVNAILKNSIDTYSPREAYLRGIFTIEKKMMHVYIIKDQDSSLVNNLSKSNCLVKIKPKTKRMKMGEKVDILIFS